MSPWFILHVGYCAECGAATIVVKNSDSGEERRYKLSADGGGDLTKELLEDLDEETC